MHPSLAGIPPFWTRPPAHLVVGLAIWLMATAVPAKDQPARPTDARNSVADFVLADQLARWAQQRQDAMAMMVAATLMRDVVLKDASNGATGNTLAAAAPQAKAMFDKAQAFAANRPEQLAIIADARVSGTRGVVGSADAVAAQLGPKASRVFQFKFEGDADAAAAVTIPADAAQGAEADIDLYVTDERGAPVCVGEGPGMPELCRWTPRRTGLFKVRIENRRSEAADFLLVVR